MDGLYIDFQGMFFREDQYPPDYSLPADLKIWQLHIPMNWAPRTKALNWDLGSANDKLNGLNDFIKNYLPVDIEGSANKI